MNAALVCAVLSLGAAQVPTNAAKAEFLREGRVVEFERASKGVTETWRLTLEHRGVTHDASFQYVDEQATVKDLGGGKREVGFVDSYRYNIAGYRLAELVGLGDIVPVSVERSWRGERGALTWWVDDVQMDEAEMNERGLKAPDPKLWREQIYRVRVFTELIYDTDRNQSNLLIAKDWSIWMIDFSRAFRKKRELRKKEWLVRCERVLLETLRSLDRERFEAELSDILTGGERNALWHRRGLIVEHYDRLVRERGADQVLY